MRTRTLLLVALAAAVVDLPAQVYRYDDAGRLVRAVYPGGGGAVYAYDDADNLLSQTPLDVPPIPMDVRVTRTSSTEARLSWQAAPGAEGYQIERRVAGSTEWESLATVGAGVTSFVDSGLTADVEYEYRVAGVGPDGPGAYSDIVSTTREAGDMTISRLIPRVASGTSFTTRFQVINLTDQPVDYRVAIYDGGGQPLALQFAGIPGGNAGFDALGGTLPASGGFFADTVPLGDLQAGYAVVEQGGGQIAVTTSITQLVEDRDPFQSAVSLAGEPELSRFPFVNTRPFTTVMAVTNASEADQEVELQANDTEGVMRCSATLPLAAGAHAAFTIQQQLACTADTTGVVELRADGAGVGPVSFVFHDFGPFTTNLPVAPDDLDATRNVIPRIATGDSFETLIQVSNLGDSPTSYRINYYDGAGAALSLPMADEDGQPIGEANMVAGTVPAGGLRTARTLASGPTLAGYALVEVGGGDVAVNTTITQIVPDRDPFQASAPLIEPVTAARLPYDNRRPLTTVMAITNPQGGASRVRLIARSLDGQERCSDVRDLAGMAHDAFVVQDRLACTVDSIGVLEIRAEDAPVAPLSFIFHDFGPFTTNLPSALE